MEDATCPKCKTTKYRNPSMKLMVNVCGHTLCDNCVELLFVKGSGSCPECNIPLRRTNFRLQLFEDAAVDKEVEIRRRVMRDFNKSEEDFASLREFNDYLEMIEDFIFNLANNVDVMETNRRIAEYKEANKNVIQKNRHKQSQELLELEDILLEEQKVAEVRRIQDRKVELEEKKSRLQLKQQLIDDLMFSEGNADEILAKHAVLAKSASEEVSKILEDSRGSSQQSKQVIRNEEAAKPFVYQSLLLNLDGPSLPNCDTNPQYSLHIRQADSAEKAAGYSEQMACFRALQEAMSGLYFCP